MVVASQGPAASRPPAIAASKKPVVLVQGGIHAGEIDGKDAGLMLLRDLTAASRTAAASWNALLDQVELLYVPIFNVDGHERRGPWGRINQRGPETHGLADHRQEPQPQPRLHEGGQRPRCRRWCGPSMPGSPTSTSTCTSPTASTTNTTSAGATAASNSWSPAISASSSEVLDPPVQKKLEAAGHLPHYLIFALDSDQPDAGHIKWQTGSPRFSDSYGAARHLPAILVENHSLKSHERRVLGTYVFLAGVLETVGRNAAALDKAIAEDRASRRDPLPLASRSTTPRRRWIPIFWRSNTATSRRR